MSTTPMFKKAAIVLALAAPLLAQAESTVPANPNVAGAATSAHLDIVVKIPRVLFFGVGTGAGALNSALTPSTTVDAITFDYAGNPQSVGIAGVAANSITNTSTGTGAFTGAAVPVRLVSNGTTVGITVTTSSGGLTDGGTNSIPWSEIGVTASGGVGHTVTTLANGTAPVSVFSGTGAINQTATWTYSYKNSTVVPAGTYGGQANGGRLTYTATMP